MGPLNYSLVFFFMSLMLAFGSCTVVFDTKATGSGLFRLMSSVALVASLLLAALLFLSPLQVNSTHLVLLGGFSLATLVAMLTHGEQKNSMQWFLFCVQNVFAFILFYLLMPKDILAIVHLFSSALVLGVITFAMTLGHWYLVTPKLSERPLQVIMMVLFPVLLLKIILLALALSRDSSWLELGSSVAFGGMFNIIMALMRVSWGILMIIGLSYYAWKLIAMRSIQSATGVLYVMTFFSFGGELISAYFYFAHGVII